jgi:hypothetical protein
MADLDLFVQPFAKRHAISKATRRAGQVPGSPLGMAGLPL